MGHLNPSGMSYGLKDLRTVLVAWWLVPADPANLAAEPGRESKCRRRRGAAVHEHEFEALVPTCARKVFEYQLDGSRFGRRRGNHAHAER